MKYPLMHTRKNINAAANARLSKTKRQKANMDRTAKARSQRIITTHTVVDARNAISVKNAVHQNRIQSRTNSNKDNYIARLRQENKLLRRNTSHQASNVLADAIQQIDSVLAGYENSETIQETTL